MNRLHHVLVLGHLPRVSLVDDLASIDGIEPIRHAGGVGHVGLGDQDGDLRSDLFRLVVSKGWTLLELRRDSQTLEDVFRDLTKGDAPVKLVQTAIDAWGRLDIVVNNAGYTLDAPIHKMSDDWWEKMLAIHVSVPFRVCRAAAPHLREPSK